MAFSPEKVEEEKIMSLFDAMRWAPSSRNEQPWRMVYATRENVEAYERMGGLLTPDNQYARNGYMLGIICAVKKFHDRDQENFHFMYDTGSAVENFFLQAVSLDLICHVMSGFDKVRVYTDFNIPKDDVVAVAMIAVGYPGDPTGLNVEKKKKHDEPRMRKPLEDFMFKETWR